MTDEHLTDRVPEVVTGGSTWTAAERSHLAACAACRDEVAMLEGVAGLGRDLPAVRDPGTLARSVRARLAEDRAARRRTRWIRATVGLAAAAAVVLAVALGDRQPDRGTPVETGALAIPLPELDGLDSGELEMVLERLDKPLGADPLMGASDPAELGDRELERMLRAEEG